MGGKDPDDGDALSNAQRLEQDFARSPSEHLGVQLLAPCRRAGDLDGALRILSRLESAQKAGWRSNLEVARIAIDVGNETAASRYLSRAKLLGAKDEWLRTVLDRVADAGSVAHSESTKPSPTISQMINRGQLAEIVATSDASTMPRSTLVDFVTMLATHPEAANSSQLADYLPFVLGAGADSVLRLAKAWAEQGYPALAIDWLDLAEHSVPPSFRPRLWAALARLFEDSGDIERAEDIRRAHRPPVLASLHSRAAPIRLGQGTPVLPIHSPTSRAPESVNAAISSASTGQWAESAQSWIEAVGDGYLSGLAHAFGAAVLAGDPQLAADLYRSLPTDIWIAPAAAYNLSLAYLALGALPEAYESVAYLTSVSEGSEHTQASEMQSSLHNLLHTSEPLRRLEMAAVRYWDGLITPTEALISVGCIGASASDDVATSYIESALNLLDASEVVLAMALVAFWRSGPKGRVGMTELENEVRRREAYGHPSWTLARIIVAQRSSMDLRRVLAESEDSVCADALRLAISVAARERDRSLLEMACQCAKRRRLLDEVEIGSASIDLALLDDEEERCDELVDEALHGGRTLAAATARRYVLARSRSTSWDPVEGVEKLERGGHVLSASTIEALALARAEIGDFRSAWRLLESQVHQFEALSPWVLAQVSGLAAELGAPASSDWTIRHQNSQVRHIHSMTKPELIETARAVVPVDQTGDRQSKSYTDTLRAAVDTLAISIEQSPASLDENVVDAVLHVCAQAGDGRSAVRLLRAALSAGSQFTSGRYQLVAQTSAKAPVVAGALAVAALRQSPQRLDWATQVLPMSLVARGQGRIAEEIVSRTRSPEVAGRMLHDILRSYAERGDYMKAQLLFDRQLTRDGVVNGYHYHDLMLAALSAGEFDTVHAILSELEASGNIPSEHHWDAAIAAYIAKGEIEAAEDVLERVVLSDGASPVHYDRIIRAWADVRDPNRAEHLLNRFVVNGGTPDGYLVEALMFAWLQAGSPERSLHLFQEYAVGAVQPDSFVLRRLFDTLARLGDSKELERAVDTYLAGGAVHRRTVEAACVALVALGHGARAREIATAWGGARSEKRSLVNVLVEKWCAIDNPLEAELLLAESDLNGTMPWPARRALAAGWLRCGDPARAMTYVDEWPDVHTTAVRSHLAVGVVAAQLAGVPAAEARYRSALELEFSDPHRARGYLAVAMGSAGEADQVRKLLHTAEAEKAPDRWHDTQREAFARALFSVGDYSRAVSLYGPVEDPTDIATGLLALRRMLELGQTDEAERVLHRLESRLDGPDRVAAYNDLLMSLADTDAGSDQVDRIKDEMIAAQLPVWASTLSAIRRNYDDLGELSEAADLRGGDASSWRDLASMLGDVVHELSSPIAAVGSLVKGARLDLQHGDSEALTLRIDRLAAAVEGVATRLDEYQLLLDETDESGTFEVSDALDWAVRRFQPGATDAGVVLYQAVVPLGDDRSLRVAGNMLTFRVILRVLLSNAIDALAASSSAVGSRSVWLQAFGSKDARGRWVDVYVRDNGPGIPEEQRRRIFEQGFTTKEGRGLGIGLSLVRSITHNMRGTVRLKPSDEGAEFWLRFPMASPMELENGEMKA